MRGKGMGKDDATTILTDIRRTLSTAEEEARGRPACLLAIGSQLNGHIFDLMPGELSIGRNIENNISLEYQGISRKHLKILVEEIDEYSVKVTAVDLGSKNGTYINEQKLEGDKLLSKGDVIKMGSIALKYLPKGDPERLTYDKLNAEAITDGLTKCYNKKYFNDSCENLVRKSKLIGSPLTLLLFDLDHFKRLNDTYGHDAGDFVLKELSDVIRKNGVRDGDIFSRYGGEEFCILLPNTTIKQGYEIAERVRKLIADHDFLYNKKKLPVTASIGVADYRNGVKNGTDLFKRVDIALYKSKDGGRNQVNYYRE
jgi:two-component system cell cycle response regulator